VPHHAFLRHGQPHTERERGDPQTAQGSIRQDAKENVVSSSLSEGKKVIPL
jgi:hypothetical protein